ncbi:ACT domain-containing protein [Nocardioides sp. GCM10027113]|uniref:ACT domain-containing protein n=1 Tax=unclassified Nocardioides TaxID=2615069 RepID=UPI0036238CF4
MTDQPTDQQPDQQTAWTLTRHRDALAVVRLGPGTEIPGWATSSTLFSVTATATETSLVCHASSVPTKARREGPFVAYQVAGPLDFALVGVLSALLAPLADAGISVFVLSTFDTDWILVPAGSADDADAAWAAAGHTVQLEESA